MFEQFWYSVTFSRVFFQTYQDELFGKVADLCGFRKLYLVFHYFYKISFSRYVERHSAKEQLIRQNANAPDIDLVIVVFSFQQFRRHIQRRATKGLPHGFRADGPSKVTQFNHSLE